MNEIIANNSVVTMSSLELVEFINSQRGPDEAALRHDDFMRKVPKVLGEGGLRNYSDTYVHPQNGQTYPCYRLPKREACLMAMSYSYDLQAKVFDRMTALEAQAQMSRAQLASKITGELAILECFTRLLRPSQSSQLAMLGKIAKQNGLDDRFLPGYAIDAASDTDAASSMPTAPITRLLKEHGLRITAHAYNKLLVDAGFLDERTRTSKSKGEKQFYCVSERGLRYGKNITSPQSPRETQPHWYVERFADLHKIVTGRLLVGNALEPRHYGDEPTNASAPSREASSRAN